MFDINPNKDGAPVIIPENDLEQHTLVVPSRTAPGDTTAAAYHRKDSIIAGIVAVLVTGVVVGGSIATWQAPSSTEAMVVAPYVVAEAPTPPSERDPYGSISLRAQSAIVYDMTTGAVLYEQQADVVRPLASLTKVMTGLIAHEEANPDMQVVITPYAIETEGDSGLLVHERWSLRDLVSFLMMTSSNDGAEAVAAAVGGLISSTPSTKTEYEFVDAFVDRMNTRATDIGLTQTRYRNPTGLDEPGNRHGGEGSAKDMAVLLAYVWENAPVVVGDTVLNDRTFTSADGFIHRANNTNIYVGTKAGLLASKTGYTDDAGGNLGVVYDAGMGHPIVIVVLGSTPTERFTDVAHLIDATNAYITSGWYEYHHIIAGSTPIVR
jgi:D-alanyl-D-alanine carboxypeptidase